MIYKTDFKLYWLAILVSFVAELFSSFPFGFITVMLLFNLSVLSWLLNTVFTNRAWYIIFFTALLSGLFGKIFFLLLSGFINIFIDFPIHLNYAMSLIFIWEIIINAAMLAACYLAGTVFLRRLNPRYLHSAHLFYGKE